MPAPRNGGKRAPEMPVREPAEAPRKKSYRLRQSRIDRAREILGTRTETETIEYALEMLVLQHEMLESVDAMYGAGVVNVTDTLEQALDSVALRDRLVHGVRGMRDAGLADVSGDNP